MLINTETDKVFKDTNNSEISQQDHVSKEELTDTAHDATPSPLPTIFSLAAEKSKKIEEPSFEDVVATCRAQMDKLLPDRYPPIAYAVKIGRHDVVKSLIDAGESVNATTPAVPVNRGRAGTESGRSPLEIAVKQQDVEMVRILTTYHRENRAAPEISYQRFAIAYFGSSEGCYWSNNRKSEQSSPLLDAFKLGNQEIVDLIIKAHTDPKRLCADFTEVQYTKNSTIMRLWIEQNFLLLKGEQKHVADSTVEMFMNKKDLTGSYADVHTLLQFGWLVTSQEFEQILIANDPQIVQLLLDHPRMEESPFFLLATHNRADLVMYLIEKGDVPLQ